jgi:hypothetical protein
VSGGERKQVLTDRFGYPMDDGSTIRMVELALAQNRCVQLQRARAAKSVPAQQRLTEPLIPAVPSLIAQIEPIPGCPGDRDLERSPIPTALEPE